MLLVRPNSWDDESSSGMLMRAAHSNGYKTVTDFLHKLGFLNHPFRASWLTLRRYIFEAERYGLVIPALEKAGDANNRSPKRMRFINANLGFSIKVFRIECGAICPECLSAQPYIRSTWSLRFYTVCHIHRRALFQSCPVCDHQLNWQRPSISKCVCGHDFLSSELRLIVSDGIDSIAAMLQCEDRREIFRISQIFEAFSVLFEDSKDHRWEGELAEACLQGDYRVADFISEHLAKKVNEIHPRLALLEPMKMGHSAAEISHRALAKLNSISMPVASSIEICGTLNAGDSALTLGLSHGRILKRLAGRHISAETEGNRKGPIRYTKASLDALLRRLYIPADASTEETRRAALTERIEKVIQEVLEKPDISAGYSLERGIGGLRKISKSKRNFQIDAGLLTKMASAAHFLSVHPEVVRSLIQHGYIEAISANDGTRAKCVRMIDVIKFNEEYAFAGVLARELNVSPTKFAERLFTIGVVAHGGPKIDGLLVYIFRRDDIKSCDLRKVATTPPTDFYISRNSSNQDFSFSKDSVGALTADEVGVGLGISVPEVYALTRKGFLIRLDGFGRRIRVTRSSYEDFRRRFFDPDLITVEEASERLGETKGEFISRWVSTRIVEVVDILIRRCIWMKDLEMIIGLKSTYMTLKEASREKNKSKSLFSRFENIGVLSSYLIGDGRTTRLYRINEIEKSMSHAEKESVLKNIRLQSSTGNFDHSPLPKNQRRRVAISASKTLDLLPEKKID